ncbi:MAG: ATP-binding protein [Desulfobacterota bacterium]|nr:ATP-binding protein [Thermodesulfobacteriota bacterium]
MAELLQNRHPLLDLIHVAFILTDLHARILYVNRFGESLFGYLREEIEGERIRILFFDEDLKYFLPNILYLAIDKAGFEGEALLRQKDGRGVFVYLRVQAFQEGGEKFLAFSFQEIQRLKSLERERLEMRQQANLGSMVEEIAHQIRNPVTVIAGYIRRLRKASLTTDRVEAYLRRVLKETERLEEMIRRVEELIKMPRPVFRREKVLEVVEGIVQTLSEEAKARGISFRLEEGSLGKEESFFVDRALLARTLSHLIENSLESLKRIQAKGIRKVIKVSLSCDEETVEITVSDRGEGIAKKNLPRIFEPFFSTRPERVGLGLTFVKKAVEDHGGTVRVESRLHRGTTVKLTFPKDRRRPIRRGWISSEAQGAAAST